MLKQRVLFILLGFLFISNLYSYDVSRFAQVISRAEEFYLSDSQYEDNDDFSERLATLSELYKFKKIFNGYRFRPYLACDVQEYNRVNRVYLPLTKEVIRRLEINTEELYGDYEVWHFGRIARPIKRGIFVLGAALTGAWALKKFKIIQQPKVYSQVKKYSLITSGAFALLNIAYNYKDQVIKPKRKPKKKNKKIRKDNFLYRSIIIDEQDDQIVEGTAIEDVVKTETKEQPIVQLEAGSSFVDLQEPMQESVLEEMK